MFKKTFIFLLLFFHLFIVISSGLDTHICIHKSGHVSFESISSNGNCTSVSELFSYNFDKEEHIHNYSDDPCIDIQINKYNKENENELDIDKNFLNDIGKKIVYNIEIKQNFEYISSRNFENIQKIPIQNKSDKIRTFILLN